MSDVSFNVKKLIFKRIKSFIEFKLGKNFSVLRSKIPGRLKDITSMKLHQSPKGFDLNIKVKSPLSGILDSGAVYSTNFSKPSLARVKVWASYKGLSHVAIPIWIKLKNKGSCKRYTNWKERDLQSNVKDLLI